MSSSESIHGLLSENLIKDHGFYIQYKGPVCLATFSSLTSVHTTAACSPQHSWLPVLPPLRPLVLHKHSKNHTCQQPLTSTSKSYAPLSLAFLVTWRSLKHYHLRAFLSPVMHGTLTNLTMGMTPFTIWWSSHCIYVSVLNRIYFVAAMLIHHTIQQIPSQIYFRIVL